MTLTDQVEVASQLGLTSPIEVVGGDVGAENGNVCIGQGHHAVLALASGLALLIPAGVACVGRSDSTSAVTPSNGQPPTQ